MAKNANGVGAIRQRADGRWEGRYTSPKDGKQHSVYGDKQKDVRQKLTEIIRQIDEGDYSDDSKLTVSQWLDIWLKEYVKGVKPYTMASYRNICINHITPEIGDKRLSKLSVVDVQRFINAKSEQLSAKTIKNIHGVLHKALEQAIDCEIIRRNVSARTNLPKVVKPEIKVLDDDAMVRFMDAVRGSKFGGFYMVDLLTGMRQSELMGLKWSDIDFKAETITIRRQLQHRKKSTEGKMFYFTTLKNGKERKIAPMPDVFVELKRIKAAQNQNRLMAGVDWVEDEITQDLVFRDPIGAHYRHSTVYKEYKRIVTEIGVPEERLHDLRHTYAVSALRAGDDIKTVQETLGHHSAAFTLDKYAHVTDDMRKDSANRMQNFINALKNNTGD